MVCQNGQKPKTISILLFFFFRKCFLVPVRSICVLRTLKYYRFAITFRTHANTTLQVLRLATGQNVALVKNLQSLKLVFAGSSTSTPTAVEVLGNKTYKPSFCPDSEMAEKGFCTATIEKGGWFGAVSNGTSATQLYFNLGGPVNISVRNARVTNQWATLIDNGMAGKHITPETSSFSWDIFSVSVDIKTNFQTVDQLLQLRKYLSAPDGLSITRGQQVDRQQSLLQLTPDAEHVAELAVPQPSNTSNPAGEALLLPLRVGPFNPRWTVGLFQRAGYTQGYYGTGDDRWTTLGLDDDHFAYHPLKNSFRRSCCCDTFN